MNNLNNSAFKLYVYFLTNEHNYNLELSPKDFIKTANYSYDTYKAAFDELLNKGYLTKIEGLKNYYIFCEESTIQSQPKENIKDTNGEKEIIDKAVEALFK